MGFGAVDLSVGVHGAGRPTVLLHAGTLAAAMTAASTIPALAARRRVIAVELSTVTIGCAGAGRSVGDIAVDVVQALSDRGVDRADVVGAGLGGLVALELAIGHARTVDRVVLVSAHYRPEGYRPEALAPEMRSGQTVSPCAGEPQVDRSDRTAAGGAWPTLALTSSGLAGRFRGWAPAELAAVAAPTLLVVGDHDLVRLEHAVEMFHLIPRSQLAVLPGATHVDLLRRPGPLVSMIDRFLTL